MDRIRVIALRIPNNRNMNQPTLEEMMDMCNIARQENEEEQKLMMEFESARNAYLSEIKAVRSKYQSKFDHILAAIDALRNKKTD